MQVSFYKNYDSKEAPFSIMLVVTESYVDEKIVNKPEI